MEVIFQTNKFTKYITFKLFTLTLYKAALQPTSHNPQVENHSSESLIIKFWAATTQLQESVLFFCNSYLKYL